MEGFLADWFALIDYINCPPENLSEECDRYGRPWIYGNSWIILKPLNFDSNSSLILGLIMVLLGVILLAVLIRLLTQRWDFIFILSPALIFAVERGNLDMLFLIFLAIISIRMHFAPGSKIINLPIFLNYFKPIFFLSSLKTNFSRKQNLSILIFGGAISLSAYSFSFGEIIRARIWTYYDFHSQFGSQGLGIIINSELSAFKQTIIGNLIITVAVWFITKGSHLRNFYRLLPPESIKYFIVWGGCFLTCYLSGSHTFYKLIFTIPLFYLLQNLNVISSSQRLILRFLLIGCLGLGSVLTRFLATTFLALFIGGIFLRFILLKKKL